MLILNVQGGSSGLGIVDDPYSSHNRSSSATGAVSADALGRNVAASGAAVGSSSTAAEDLSRMRVKYERQKADLRELKALFLAAQATITELQVMHCLLA